MKKRLLILVLTGILSQLSVFSQNDIQISNFMFCGQSYNPAFVGLTKVIDVSLLAREQWTDFSQAPSTQILNFGNHTEYLGSFGLSIINDKLGYEKSINARFIYAYPVHLSKNSVIHAGIGGGFINRSLDGASLIYENKTEIDPDAIYNNINEYNPTIDLGLVFSSQKLTLGLSATHLAKSRKSATFYDISRHYYFFGSYIINASKNIDVVPSFHIKSNEIITQYEANTNVIFENGEYWLGLSYRYNDAIVGLLGLKVHKSIKIAYSYDFDTGDIKLYNSGSHEIMIIASFNKPEKSYFKSPRIFN